MFKTSYNFIQTQTLMFEKKKSTSLMVWISESANQATVYLLKSSIILFWEKADY